MGAKQLKLFKQLSRHGRASAAGEGGLKQYVFDTVALLFHNIE